jgi:hypothetical protein
VAFAGVQSAGGKRSLTTEPGTSKDLTSAVTLCPAKSGTLTNLSERIGAGFEQAVGDTMSCAADWVGGATAPVDGAATENKPQDRTRAVVPTRVLASFKIATIRFELSA